MINFRSLIDLQEVQWFVISGWDLLMLGYSPYLTYLFDQRQTPIREEKICNVGHHGPSDLLYKPRKRLTFTVVHQLNVM